MEASFLYTSSSSFLTDCSKLGCRFTAFICSNRHDSNGFLSPAASLRSFYAFRLLSRDGSLDAERNWQNTCFLQAGARLFESQFLDQTAKGTYFRHGPIHLCQSLGKESSGQSAPEDDDGKNVEDTNASESGESKSTESEILKGDAKQNLDTDWRSFRARLVAGEQEIISRSRTVRISGKSWAHPLPVPEPGCVLVATERLDGLPSFERTVILLLRMGSNRTSEGPFGIILNRPLSKSINDLKLTNRTLTNAFGHCQLHFGGPLEAWMFLLLNKDGKGNHFEQVMPGIQYGYEDGLKLAAELVKAKALLAEDFRFYMGYAGWGLDQLKCEISSGLWCVAACSSDLIASPSPTHLWADILQLMGGQYADLSKKPKTEE